MTLLRHALSLPDLKDGVSRAVLMKTREKLSAAAFVCVAGLSAGLAFVGFVYLIKLLETL